VSTRLTRSRFLRGALGTAGALALAPSKSWAAVMSAPRLVGISVRNAGRRYEGDRPLFATISPGIAGRDTAVVSFELKRGATVQLDVVRTALRQRTVVWTIRKTFSPGPQSLTWTPEPDTAVGTYVIRLTVESGTGARRVYGGQRPTIPGQSRAPVVRVLGIEAACGRRSYVPGDLIWLRIVADARRLTLQTLHCGPEPEYSDRADEMSGVPVGKLVTLPWLAYRNAPQQVRLLVEDWPTGVYAVRLTAKDGRVGFAPFVVRPKTLGASRQAVVLPTNTWQAYNFYDADGDGFGDTWYAGGNPPVVLTRPYRERGVPPRFHRYDAPYLRWLSVTGKTPDYITDDDLETIVSGDELRRLYDLVVFPGHTEYETAHVYDVIQRFRDLGGRLISLSANAFFWKIKRTQNEIHRVKLWRNLGRPEAALLGAQYRANDNGTHQGSFVVANAQAVPWLFEGTEIENGSTIGDAVNGYGIEVDAMTRSSPPGTVLVATIPNIFGQGINAEMTYYETPAGARVFNAGALDFGGSVLTYPVSRMLENLWSHMLAL
jgi:hypothetical protein